MIDHITGLTVKHNWKISLTATEIDLDGLNSLLDDTSYFLNKGYVFKIIVSGTSSKNPTYTGGFVRFDGKKYFVYTPSYSYGKLDNYVFSLINEKDVFCLLNNEDEYEAILKEFRRLKEPFLEQINVHQKAIDVIEKEYLQKKDDFLRSFASNLI